MAAVLIKDYQIKTDVFNLGSVSQATTVTFYGGGTDGANITIQGALSAKTLNVETIDYTTVVTIDSDQIITGSLTVNGNTILGNATTDTTSITGAVTIYGGQIVTLKNNDATPANTITLNAGTGAVSTITLAVSSTSTYGGNMTVTGSILPSVNNTYYLGSETYKWKAVFSDVVVGTAEIAGTKNETFTIDTDDTGGDLSLVFGTTVNKRITWSVANSRFELNDDVYITNTLAVGTTTTLGGTTTITSGSNFIIKDNAATPNTVFQVTGSSGSTSISGLLTVAGAVDFNSTVAIAGDITLDKATAQSITSSQALTIATSVGTLTLNPTTTIEAIKNLNATAGLDVTGADFTVGGTNFVVTVGTGNTSISGTLGVTGAITATSTYTGNGNMILQAAANFTIKDASATPNDVFTIIGSSGNTNIAGTLTVAGLVTCSGGASVTGNLAITGTVDGVDVGTANNFTGWIGVNETPNGTITNFHLAGGVKYQTSKLIVIRQGVICRGNYTEDADRLGVTFNADYIPQTGDLIEVWPIKDLS